MNGTLVVIIILLVVYGVLRYITRKTIRGDNRRPPGPPRPRPKPKPRNKG